MKICLLPWTDVDYKLFINTLFVKIRCNVLTGAIHSGVVSLPNANYMAFGTIFKSIEEAMEYADIKIKTMPNYILLNKHISREDVLKLYTLI